MRDYEIRILQETGAMSIIYTETHLSDAGAIKSARRMAHGRQFEVWWGMECITGLAKPPQTPTAVPSENQALH